jgi:hypothetical protein
MRDERQPAIRTLNWTLLYPEAHAASAGHDCIPADDLLINP